MADGATSLSALRLATPARYRAPGDRFFKIVVLVLSTSVILLALAMGVVIWLEASPTFAEFGYLSFLTETTWDPVAAIHGTLPFIFGTLITSFGALLLSVLPALAIAIFVSEYAPKWIANIINYTVDLLAAIPSVVVGLWGIFVLAPYLRDNLYFPIYNWALEYAVWITPVLGTPSTFNLATGTIVLALMITPYTVALSRDAIRLVPREQREAAWALGATRWEVMRMAVLPYARSGILAGILLSLARGLGETMAMAMLVGNRNRMPFTLFGPAATMPSLIINEFREAVEPLHYTSIMAVGFYLFILTIGINLIASYIQTKLTQQRKSV
jgi:phosphate transport system permease protein